ncbi:putative urea hydro-lyase/cyanamide hydratase [Karstenula rhodostoma CBS 690.94]|uniref:Urea hydro-lyase/cyanamide hydratase n=1 Tax=Karstenula rhodostoma CBS 690.94 TaxID=1392251 RepID=A0A9P4PNQ1_9PLEO|nr:putative urea hydro-lyase/cyanamide hydratase [Karstenula rhodostoma CBS 690.94]
MSQPADHSKKTLESYGWTSVPHDQSVLLKDISPWDPVPYEVTDIRIPDTELAKKVKEYAQERLPEEVYNHSMRVYLYGASIAQKHLPSFLPSLETYYLTSLLHDIGTTQENLHATLLSFEFYGGYLALDVLKEYGASREQAESVAEAIIRHQDLGVVGTITIVGQLIQLATLFDNAGKNPTLISKHTIESVVAAYPRKQWSGCFAQTIEEELTLKPWAHSSAIPRFAETVAGNKLMEPWDR